MSEVKIMWSPHLRLGWQWQSYQVTSPTILVIVPLKTWYECTQGLQSGHNCCILLLDKSNCFLHLDKISDWSAFIGKTWIAPRGFGWNGLRLKKNYNWLSWVLKRSAWFVLANLQHFQHLIVCDNNFTCGVESPCFTASLSPTAWSPPSPGKCLRCEFSWKIIRVQVLKTFWRQVCRSQCKRESDE